LVVATVVNVSLRIGGRMTRRRVGWVLLTAALLLVGLSVYAQVQRPYRPGSVWSIAFIRMKPGMESAYLTYVANDWKREQEALKTAGAILSYRVISAEAHGPTDWNLMLMTEYKDLATYEASDRTAQDVAQKMFGGDEKIRQGYKERLDIREVLGERLAREIVLEPRATAGTR
jgi:hypothetical protein